MMDNIGLIVGIAFLFGIISGGLIWSYFHVLGKKQTVSFKSMVGLCIVIVWAVSTPTQIINDNYRIDSPMNILISMIAGSLFGWDNMKSIKNITKKTMDNKNEDEKK